MQKIPYDRDATEEEQAFRKKHSELLLNRRPYFFSHLYKDSRKEFKKYYDEQEFKCYMNFDIHLKELLSLSSPNEEQKQFIDSYYEWCPLIVSNSVMNKICYHIEDFDFNLRQKIKFSKTEFDYNMYKDLETTYTVTQYKRAVEILKDYKKQLACNITIYGDFFRGSDPSCLLSLAERLEAVSNSSQVITSILVDYFYKENEKSNKDILWTCCGETMFKNLLEKCSGSILFPFKDADGEILYLGEHYDKKEVTVW